MSDKALEGLNPGRNIWPAATVPIGKSAFTQPENKEEELWSEKFGAGS